MLLCMAYIQLQLIKMNESSEQIFRIKFIDKTAFKNLKLVRDAAIVGTNQQNDISHKCHSAIFSGAAPRQTQQISLSFSYLFAIDIDTYTHCTKTIISSADITNVAFAINISLNIYLCLLLSIRQSVLQSERKQKRKKKLRRQNAARECKYIFFLFLSTFFYNLFFLT